MASEAIVKTYSVFWPSYILPSVLHQNWLNSHAVTLTGAISPLGVQINFERKQNAFFTVRSSSSVACPRMECCRVDDTSPERAVTGLSPGRVDPDVD